jgi:lysophospholipase L1-like esterase
MKLLVHGDSNVVANYVPGGNWPQAVADALGFSTLVNRAQAGWYAQSVANDLQATIAEAADLNLVMVGCNNQANAVQAGVDQPLASSLATFLTAMGTIIDSLQPTAILSPAFTFATRPVTIDPLTYVGASSGAREVVRYQAWIPALAALCASKDCPFIDVYTHMATLSHTLTAAQFEAFYHVPALDGYHLSAAGHALVAAYVVQRINAVTVTPDPDVNDLVAIPGLTGPLTLANPEPSAVLRFLVCLSDNGTPRPITYGSAYRPIGMTLPTTTVAGKTMYLGFVRNELAQTWDCLGAAKE